MSRTVVNLLLLIPKLVLLLLLYTLAGTVYIVVFVAMLACTSIGIILKLLGGICAFCMAMWVFIILIGGTDSTLLDSWQGIVAGFGVGAACMLLPKLADKLLYYLSYATDLFIALARRIKLWNRDNINTGYLPHNNYSDLN